jgi:hypothetical protein
MDAKLVDQLHSALFETVLWPPSPKLDDPLGASRNPQKR